MGCAIMRDDQKIPVCVLITTKNEGDNIVRCLQALGDFAHVMVIDSHSEDNTAVIARDMGVEVVSYCWNGEYPKKRGWCLETLDLPYDWVFWVDGDEVVTFELIEELRVLFSDGDRSEAGFFVRGQYVLRGGHVLRHGLQNNKIALMNIRKMEFPVVDDLGITGMGEIEGHYQPVVRGGVCGSIGQVVAPLLHYAEDDAAWKERHERYAVWECEMTRRGLWPKDPVYWRERAKRYLRTSIFRPYVMFLYSYVLKMGFLDGVHGYRFALSRKCYCDMIQRHLRG